MDIAAHIKANGLDRKAICEQAGISRSLLSMVERRTRKIGPEKASALADALGVSPAALRPDLADLFGPAQNETGAT